MEFLFQEPWCFRPEDVARLTWWQIRELYAAPAIRRAREMRGDRTETPRQPPPDPPKPDDPPPDPETVRRWAKSLFGGYRLIEKGKPDATTEQ